MKMYVMSESRGLKMPIKGAVLGNLNDLTKWIVECHKTHSS